METTDVQLVTLACAEVLLLAGKSGCNKLGTQGTCGMLHTSHYLAPCLNQLTYWRELMASSHLQRCVSQTQVHVTTCREQQFQIEFDSKMLDLGKSWCAHVSDIAPAQSKHAA